MSEATQIVAGLALREARIKALLSQSALARLSGVSRRTVIRIEQGEYSPGDIVQERLARAVGVPREELFAGLVPDPEPDESEEALA